ncbi:hypothetical protein BHE74_00000823 [Ensete ventricosum]|nr:hypothetical protein GW17_00007810 [Ensete ventricosum]RWW90037.1 hypothetical protein BHE74_00000823 [Ensete ventricosum]
MCRLSAPWVGETDRTRSPAYKKRKMTPETSAPAPSFADDSVVDNTGTASDPASKPLPYISGEVSSRLGGQGSSESQRRSICRGTYVPWRLAPLHSLADKPLAAKEHKFRGCQATTELRG